MNAKLTTNANLKKQPDREFKVKSWRGGHNPASLTAHHGFWYLMKIKLWLLGWTQQRDRERSREKQEALNTLIKFNSVFEVIITGLLVPGLRWISCILFEALQVLAVCKLCDLYLSRLPEKVLKIVQWRWLHCLRTSDVMWMESRKPCRKVYCENLL